MYKRVLLKLSGEALKENSDMILDGNCLDSMAHMVKSIHDAGIQVCIVIGAGNIWRGKIAKDAGMDQYEADFMGMMGTVINAVALSAKLKALSAVSTLYATFTSGTGPIAVVTRLGTPKAFNLALKATALITVPIMPMKSASY